MLGIVKQMIAFLLKKKKNLDSYPLKYLINAQDCFRYDVYKSNAKSALRGRLILSWLTGEGEASSSDFSVRVTIRKCTNIFRHSRARSCSQLWRERLSPGVCFWCGGSPSLVLWVTCCLRTAIGCYRWCTATLTQGTSPALFDWRVLQQVV